MVATDVPLFNFNQEICFKLIEDSTIWQKFMTQSRKFGSVNREEQIAGRHMRVLGDGHLGDAPADLRRDRQHVGLQVCVIGRGMDPFVLPPGPKTAARKGDGGDQNDGFEVFHVETCRNRADPGEGVRSLG